MLRMGSPWQDLEQGVVEEAERDLRGGGGHVRPSLIAYRGDRSLFVAFARSPATDEVDVAPIVELICLAAGMRADRLALVTSGRATSSEDPIPPVNEDGDLRQRILIVLRCDGHRQRVAVTSTILPFDLVAGDVRWGTRVQPEEPPEGTVVDLVRVAVEVRHRLRMSRDELAEHAARCAAEGHLIAFSDTAAALLTADGSTFPRMSEHEWAERRT
jgi:hypothetical protein